MLRVPAPAALNHFPETICQVLMRRSRRPLPCQNSDRYGDGCDTIKRRLSGKCLGLREQASLRDGISNPYLCNDHRERVDVRFPTDGPSLV